MIEGKGMYTENEKDVLITCVRPQQIEQMKSIVRQTDPHAFIIVTDATEVIGKGFSDKNKF